MNYIDSNEIINDVKNRMAKHFAANKVDESILPRVIRKCVGNMGLRIYPEKRAVLEICNYKAALPEGFKTLGIAMLCSGRAMYVPKPTTRQDQLICGTSCEVPCETYCTSEVHAYGKHCAMTDECGNVLRIVETQGFDRFETSEFSVLRASSNSKPWCTTGCLNLYTKNPYEFEIKETPSGKVIQTNVCDGKLYIEYLTDIEHEDSFDIPDNETVKDWIFEELRKEIYSYLWDSGEEVKQRLDESKQELFIKKENARQVYSQRSVQERYDTANRLVKRFKAMESWMSPRIGVYCPRY